MGDFGFRPIPIQAPFSLADALAIVRTIQQRKEAQQRMQLTQQAKEELDRYRNFRAGMMVIEDEAAKGHAPMKPVSPLDLGRDLREGKAGFVMGKDETGTIVHKFGDAVFQETPEARQARELAQEKARTGVELMKTEIERMKKPTALTGAMKMAVSSLTKAIDRLEPSKQQVVSRSVALEGMPSQTIKETRGAELAPAEKERVKQEITSLIIRLIENGHVDFVPVERLHAIAPDVLDRVGKRYGIDFSKLLKEKGAPAATEAATPPQPPSAPTLGPESAVPVDDDLYRRVQELMFGQ